MDKNRKSSIFLCSGGDKANFEALFWRHWLVWFVLFFCIREAFQKKPLNLWACSYLGGGVGSVSQRSHLLRIFCACSKPTCWVLWSPKTNFVFTPNSIFHIFSDLCDQWPSTSTLSPLIWYKQWKVRSGCLEKVALGNSRGCDDLREFPRATFSDNH